MLNHNEKGFTLIELLIVIVIIGILAAVAIPRFQGVADSARVSAAESELEPIKTALFMYQVDDPNSAFPATGDITNYTTLAAVVLPFVQIPNEADAKFVFGTYESATTDTFVLKAKARDTDGTVIEIHP